MKTISRVISSAVLAALTAIVVFAAKKYTALMFLWYPKFSRELLQKIAALTGRLPFPVWEAAVLLLIIWAIYTLVYDIRKGRILRWLSGVLFGAVLGVFLFTCLWGVGHFGPDLTQQIVNVEDTAPAELSAATAFFAEKAGQTAAETMRDQDNCFVPTSFETLSAKAGDGYAALAKDHTCFYKDTVPVKELLAWRLFSYAGTTGIFVPFTAEACVNPDTYAASLPYTMCHELAHRQGASAEEDANFCAFLACDANPDADFQYSGYYSAFLYCYNALYKVAPAEAGTIRAALSPAVEADLEAASAHYKPYEGAVQDAAQKLNDGYLKAFSEEAGVQSYGQVADALIAWYLQNKA